MAEKIYCLSCKKMITKPGTARFKCPKCGKYEIIRCLACRETCVKYKCPECGFEGPN